jgi:uncharacterized protein
VREPVRTCAGCGRKAPQRELVRYTAPDGTLVADRGRRASGRGVYTCPRRECLEQAAAHGGLARTLHRSVAVPDALKTSPGEE